MAKDIMGIKTWNNLTGLPEISKKTNELINLAVDKNSWESIYYNILYDYCTSEFMYEGLEEFERTGVTSRIIEDLLFKHGSIAMFRDFTIESDPLLFIPYQYTGRYDFYNQPLSIRVDIQYDNQRWQKELYRGEYVILHNNGYSKNMTASYMCMTYAQELADIRETMAVNRNATRTPLIASASAENYLSVSNKLNQIMNGSSVVVEDEYGSTSSVRDSLKSLSTGAPYNVDKLTDHLHDVFNEICTFIGIENVNVDKKERLVEKEADSTKQQVNRSRDSRYQSRVDSFNELRRLTGIDIKVVKSQQNIDREELKEKILEARLTEGGDLDGNLHNDD